MRERVSHRHRRITGRIAAWLLILLAGAAAQAVLAGTASHAEDQITAAQDLARRCLASGYLYCDDRTDR